MTLMKDSTGVDPITSRQRSTMKTRLIEDRVEMQSVVDALVAQLASFQASRRDTPTNDEQDPEGGSIDFERSQSTVVLSQARRHLEQVDNALLRIDAGTYGDCTRCGNTIPFGRIQARPYTPHCVRCAELMGR